MENNSAKKVIDKITVKDYWIIDIPNYESLRIKCGDNNIITSQNDNGLDFFLGGGYYSCNGSLIGRDDMYYFDNSLIIGMDEQLHIFELNNRRIINQMVYIISDNSNFYGFILGISYRNDNLYYIYRSGKYNFKNRKRNYRVLMIQNHTDTLYRYNIDQKQNEEILATENIIIRYTDKEIYMLTRDFELIHYNLETQETNTIGKIQKSCDEVHNCKDIIVFYNGNHLLKIYDTSKNSFVEIP